MDNIPKLTNFNPRMEKFDPKMTYFEALKRVCPNCGQLINTYMIPQNLNDCFIKHNVLPNYTSERCSMSDKAYIRFKQKIKLPNVPKVLKPEHLWQGGGYSSPDNTRHCVGGWITNSTPSEYDKPDYRPTNAGTLRSQYIQKMMDKIEYGTSLGEWNDKTPAQKVCDIFNSIFEGDLI